MLLLPEGQAGQICFTFSSESHCYMVGGWVGGWGKGITLFEISQASPARPSGTSNMKIKIYEEEDVGMVTVA
jgi:hypothetical protein